MGIGHCCEGLRFLKSFRNQAFASLQVPLIIYSLNTGANFQTSLAPQVASVAAAKKLLLVHPEAWVVHRPHGKTVVSAWA